MSGIRFPTDEKGRKVGVLLDLKKHGAIWEDFWTVWCLNRAGRKWAFLTSSPRDPSETDTPAWLSAFSNSSCRRTRNWMRPTMRCSPAWDSGAGRQSPARGIRRPHIPTFRLRFPPQRLAAQLIMGRRLRRMGVIANEK